MKHTSLACTLRGVALAGQAVLALSVPAAVAQDGFLFDEPRVTLGARGGFNLAAANSDVYGFFTEQLTLEHDDFSGVALLGEVGMRVAPRLDLVGGVGYTSTRPRSESRTHEGTDGLPIAQTTRLYRVPVTVMLKYYLVPRGRTIGRHAWIPAGVTPYVGIGGGALYYELGQSGEFVDFQTCDAENVCEIFSASLESTGWTPTAHVAGGADFWLSPRFALSLEARYQWASAALHSDFIGFDDIDLRGLVSTVGVSMRF